MMKSNISHNISPLDGRYADITHELAVLVSESALIRARINVETTHLLALSAHSIIRPLTIDEKEYLVNIAENITDTHIQEVKTIEQQTHHDVKAVEYALSHWFSEHSMKDLIPFIHFGLTSEDTNNLAYRLIFTQANTQVMIPQLTLLVTTIIAHADQYKEIPMLARTHGQPAVPTTVGKELIVFASRLTEQLNMLKQFTFTGKLNGAVGNYNALQATYPTIDWIEYSHQVIQQLGFLPKLATTQINPPEDIITFLHTYLKLNNILLNMNQDLWRYISDGWFIQKNNASEIGSSVMPQKINPIHFENSEGNCIVANGLIEVITRQIAVSRLQRDLSGSTVMRNIASVLGYSLVAYHNSLEGLQRVSPNQPLIEKFLDNNWSILAEAAQTYLRSKSTPHAYETLMKATKGMVLDQSAWKAILEKLDITDEVRSHLLTLTPTTYTGYASLITTRTIEHIRTILDLDRIKSSEV